MSYFTNQRVGAVMESSAPPRSGSRSKLPFISVRPGALIVTARKIAVIEIRRDIRYINCSLSYDQTFHQPKQNPIQLARAQTRGAMQSVEFAPCLRLPSSASQAQ